MKANKLTIKYSGLKEGAHDFHFDLDDRFFEQFDSDVNKGIVKVDINFVKKTNLLVLENSLHGEVEVECDRCLDPLNIPVFFTGKLFVKIQDAEPSEKDLSMDDEIMYVSTAESEINLDQYIYESVMLSLPYKKVHPDDEHGETTCNKDMIAKLDKHLVDEDKDDDTIDPRWETLRNLLGNNSN